MNVRLKTKSLKNNRLSYYLQYYDPGTGKRHKEYLGLYLIDKPRNEFDRYRNKDTKALAQRVHSKRLLEFQEVINRLRNVLINHYTFINFYYLLLYQLDKHLSEQTLPLSARTIPLQSRLDT